MCLFHLPFGKVLVRLLTIDYFCLLIGLGFRPVSDNTAEKSLISYSSSDRASVQKWTGLLDKFLEGELP